MAAALLTAWGLCEVQAVVAAKPPASVVGQKRQGAKLLAAFDSGLRAFCSVAFTPDGRRLVVEDEEGARRVWDIAHKRRIAFHPAPKYRSEVQENTLPSPLLSPDGNSRVTVSRADRIVMYNRSAGRRRMVNIPDSAIQTVAFTPDSRWLLVSAYTLRNRFGAEEKQNSIHVVRVSDGRLAGVLKVGQYNLDTLVFSRRGDQVATIQHHGVSGAEPAHGEDIVKVWDTRTWQMRFEYPTGDDVQHVQFTPDGRTLLVLCTHWTRSDYHLNKYDLGGGQGGVLPVYNADEASHFGAVELSEDGTLLVSVFGGHAKCQQVTTGQSLSLFDRANDYYENAPDRIALSSDNRLLADVDSNGTVNLWQMPMSSARRKMTAGK